MSFHAHVSRLRLRRFPRYLSQIKRSPLVEVFVSCALRLYFSLRHNKTGTELIQESQFTCQSDVLCRCN